ncbi:cation diffusion facilitator family transporter [Rubellimicrobium arenae]|uniref:cation diffusion facilitator family transporter n=1 Tax=Rubellimicrobium arenae TaxID=2817372 RepID=UPI001B303D1C|nr:cation diffusion facilitator family transporter [Rubellimicrobium arenae]
MSALVLTGGFMMAEAVAGVVSGSLALIADAGHMLTDTAALGLSWWAARVARQPATPERTFGQHRFQVLAALVNGSGLMVIAFWIAVEAVRRLAAPVEVLGGTMLTVAILGLMVNVASFLILHGGSHGNLNMRGALLHVVGDMLGSAAAILAAVVILLTGWTPADPLLSVLVAVLILRSAWTIASDAWHILMEGTPEGFDPARLKADLMAHVPGVEEVSHVHLWSLTPDRPLVTLDARISAEADHEVVLGDLRKRLASVHHLAHATIELSRTG